MGASDKEFPAYPTLTLQEEAFESPTGEFLAGLARGEDPDLRVHRGYQVCARIVLPPFPFDDAATDDENSRGAAVVFEGDPAGENGMPLVVTGKGETMQAAREQCYGPIDDVVVPDLYYRDDVGERWSQGDGDRLQAWGYLGPAA